MTQSTQDLTQAGVSIWLDDLSRDLIKSGQLASKLEDLNVQGVTTNPSIFAAAISSDQGAYADQLKSLVDQGADVKAALFSLTTTDVQNACDVLAPPYKKDPSNGRVSIEVDPFLAHDVDETVAQAKKLSETVGRDNVMVKIPATAEGLEALPQVIAEGISVNATLIFSLDQYKKTVDAYIRGLEQAAKNGHDLSKIYSVASFFVSRLDSDIDAQLEKINTPEASALKGKAGVANARLAYQIFQEETASDRWKLLAQKRANVQKPLWASTGVKNPGYPDTMYVTDLVAPDTVNTMPNGTLNAFADHGQISGNTIEGTYPESKQVFEDLKNLNVYYDDTVKKLETEGVEKFQQSWKELTDDVTAAMKKTQN